MFTPIMEFGFVQWINIYSPDEKSFIRFMKASQDELVGLLKLNGL